MEKEQLSSFKEKRLIYSGEGSKIFRLPDKRILKVASPIVIQTCRLVGTTYEQKILSTNARSISEIVSPLTAVYDRNFCCAYTMEDINGVDLNNYDKKYTLQQRSDLYHYFDLYKKIEDIVIKANKAGIVIPDLCTCDNIIIMPDGSLKFIDYDGMQHGPKDKGIALSTSLGDPKKYLISPKFSDGTCHFSTELDKTSLTILMFLVIFNIDLNKIGQYNPFERKIITIKDIFDLLDLNDPDFMNKVAANISSDKPGVYLQDELYKISRNYEMVTKPIQTPDGEAYLKKLIRK